MKTERPAVIEITNLRKSFGALEVLKNISLKLYEGENLVVLGKSGSGKSVLIKCMVRLLEADSGSIQILGEEVQKLKINSLSALRKKIGFLFQSGALYDSMTVRDNLEFPLRRIKRKLSQKERDVVVSEVLDNVGLAEVIDKMPSQLSGGMRKRVGLARAIVTNPKIILYDEPTSGLDPVSSRMIDRLIDDLRKELGENSKDASILSFFKKNSK